MFYVEILDSVFKQFKDSGEMAIKNKVPTMSQNPSTPTTNE